MANFIAKLREISLLTLLTFEDGVYDIYRTIRADENFHEIHTLNKIKRTSDFYIHIHREGRSSNKNFELLINIIEEEGKCKKRLYVSRPI